VSREARSLHQKSIIGDVLLPVHHRRLQQLVVLAVTIIAQQASLAAIGSHPAVSSVRGI